ncbi:YxcD family protein [Paenibacillus silvae]|uniref:YxcD family protein n=1 Tax=Paenibacillus silvae TaxID=1325358 RepID=UPI0011A8D4B9|nr:MULTISPECIES: YxcD family protein [Paenibacillus]MCK6076541.1 YxcD family protein [Paenibacillus silvae]MCK6150968.1 YxcD family protein [Paenibacillus silvae]MCK6269228.1 YxcD family protein [Paenibacillus silvae]
MVLSMDEIVNAICIHMAERKGVRPTDVTVELSWEEDTGYSAEVWIQGRSQFLVESNMIEAILRYLHSEYNIRAYREDVTLDLDEEITAIVNQQY